jgi:5-(carboxyamino)imidazole ribonucleotide mutase
MAGTVSYRFYKCLEEFLATVALNGSKNAGILAAQIIGSHDINKVIQYKLGLKESVIIASESLLKQ